MVDGVLRDPVVRRTTERRNTTYHGWKYTEPEGLSYLAHSAAVAQEQASLTMLWIYYNISRLVEIYLEPYRTLRMG